MLAKLLRLFKKKSEEDEFLRNRGHFFVVYAMKEEHYWKYGKFPKGWEWEGGGSTVPMKINKNTGKIVITKNVRYPKEEQFGGPKETKNEMKKYIHTFFTKLKEKGKISRFKIVNSLKSIH